MSREKSELVASRIEQFVRRFPESAFVTITPTMLDKNIVDAIQPFRQILKRAGVHDFAVQGQGPNHKRVVDVLFYGSRSLESPIEIAMSLYRPKTKEGDPRFWISRLGKHAVAGDILAVGVEADGPTMVVNLTSVAESEFEHLTSFEQQAGHEIDDNLPLSRLVAALRDIAQRGPIPADCEGPTAVGRTMETALGIEINSRKEPDWEDLIELKFGRPRPGQRKTLFARVPDWDISPLKSSAALLDAFGYERRDDRRLYVTVSSTPNSQGLFLDCDDNFGRVWENSSNPALPVAVGWRVSGLQQSLLDKHSETCWIRCEESKKNGWSYFRPLSILYTRAPRVDTIPLLIKSGDITVDHLIKRKGGRVTEKGPLWKVSAKKHGLLLPQAAEYDLAD